VIATYHQNNIADWEQANIKYVAQDGKKEAVFDYHWNVILNDEDLGTYNFFSPTTNAIKHIRYDVKPWEEWWNTRNDSTTYKERRQIYTWLF
jgi:hypothetical protein